MTTLTSILRAVAAEYAVTVGDLTGPRRTKLISEARQVVMYLGREMTSWSLQRIGRAVNRDDHTTVLHGIAAVVRRLADGGVAERVGRIRVSMGAGDATLR